MKSTFSRALAAAGLLAATGLVLSLSAPALAQGSPPDRPEAPPGTKPDAAKANDKDKEKPDFPEFKEVAKDFVKVVSTADGADSLYTLWFREKDQQLLAELPRNFEKQRYFFAMTIASGTPWAGLQGADRYVYWRRYDKRLALIEPNLDVRSTGDQESKTSVSRLFTDRVIVDVPIVCMGAGGGPVIDLDALLVGNANEFFGPQAARLNSNLATVKEVKAFPQNIEVSVEAPRPPPQPGAGGGGGMFGGGGAADTGRLRTYHYSISLIPDNPDYKPRVADERVGYFTTSFRDLGQLGKVDKWVRYINRWNLEKADPKLKLSPPKQPIVFYIENTVPVRYRRWVREGVLYWNKAYEAVGIAGAIEVYYQDKATGAHMDKDPEDVRYNFLRWLSNDISTAIGPSRVNPMTGQILDADIILTDGWIRAFWTYSQEILPHVAAENLSPETLVWLEKKPQWDPRVRLVPPAEREAILAQRAAARGIQRFGGTPESIIPSLSPEGLEPEGMPGRRQSLNWLCSAAYGRAIDMSFAGLSMMSLEAAAGEDDKPKDEGKDGEKPAEEEKEQTLDGIPEWFIGPMLADLVAHEVGHTLGLRHNFKASSIYSMAKINSEEIKGQKPFGGSVMDYNALPNVNMGAGAVQGDYGMIDIGPYDMWAIEYGYCSGDPKKVAQKAADPLLVFATDEDTWGPDPLATRRDLGADPLEYAKSRMRLIQTLRQKIVDKFVKDGDSWSKARRGYLITLSQQASVVSIMANWIGGAYVNRDKKGDPGARDPITVVPAEAQRDALRFVIDNAFEDNAFGLTPDLLNRMSVDKWYDDGGMRDIMEDPTWPVHERILAVQAATLTMLMNPTTLARVYDNEFRISSGEDALTLPEVLNTISASIWTELEAKPGEKFTVRKPMISSLRRNLQREHVERLIDLTMPEAIFGSASKTISTLATARLRSLRDTMKTMTEGQAAERLDPYTFAHLSECRIRIDKALDAIYIYNTDALGGGGGLSIIFGNQQGQTPAPTP